MSNELFPWNSITELKENRDLWEKRAKQALAAEDYYREQLAAAHELLGRTVHQASERWDSLRLTKYFPTDNLHGKRTISNPSGEKT